MSARARIGVLAVLAAVAWGCSDGSREAPPAAEVSEPLATETAITPAVYRTGLTFSGFGTNPVVLHLRFLNRTGPAALERAYHGWMADSAGWRPLLAVEDSLPVPRAAWRVLPSDSLRLRVGAGGTIIETILGAGAGRMRLLSGAPIADWGSPTGVRETLRAGAVTRDGIETPGLLVTRRSARPRGGRPLREPSRMLLLTDSLGGAVLVLHAGPVPETPATAWTWAAGTATEWPRAVLRPLPADSSGPLSAALAGDTLPPDIVAALPPAGGSRWLVALPGAEIAGEVWVRSGVDRLPDDGPGVRLLRLSGALLGDGQWRLVGGIGVVERLP